MNGKVGAINILNIIEGRCLTCYGNLNKIGYQKTDGHVKYVSGDQFKGEGAVNLASPISCSRTRRTHT